MKSSKKNSKVLVLKLGGQCNLKCKHCHCLNLSFKFNNDIFNYIDSENIKRITFCGGEPLLYWNIIKMVIERYKNTIDYKFVTNGTLLKKEMVDFCNRYNVHVFFSYDGENESRDNRYTPNWEYLSDLNKKGLAILYSYDNKDISKLLEDVRKLVNKYDLHILHNTLSLNFPHTTNKNDYEKADRELAKEYCKIMCRFIEVEFMNYHYDRLNRENNIYKKYPVLSTLFDRFIRKHNIRGVKCFNENIVILNIEGKFMLCPYGEQYVGDIYTGINWNKVESYIPDKCKNCPQWESCMNTCIANITDNECYISKVMYKHFYKLMNKYNVTYDELADFIGR